MLIFGANVGVSEDRAVVAIFEGRDPRGVGAEGEQHDIIHQLPIVWDLGRNAIGGPREIGGGQARLPTSGVPLLSSPFDAPLDLMYAAEIFLKSLPVRNRKSLPQRLGIFEHSINHTAVAAVEFGAEELVEG